MFTLLLPGRSHVITDDSYDCLVAAMEAHRTVATIPIELSGAGSGAWEVTINVNQIVALVRHPVPAGPGPGPAAGPALRALSAAPASRQSAGDDGARLSDRGVRKG